MKSPLIKAATVLALLALPALALAYSSSPPNGRTNAPGEGNCTACHATYPLNSGSGSMTVSDLSGWAPGQTYDLEVVVADPGASRWGFEFTILDAAGNSVGALATTDAQAQLSSSGARTYAKQTSAGTQNGTTGQATWSLRWTAPESGAGDVTLYATGNAANGNFSASGDRIYAIASTWSEGAASPAPLPALAGAELLPNYPNPFNPRTNVVFELARDQHVDLAVYSLDGRLVARLESGTRSSGRHEITWDGLDQGGRAVPSGAYLYRLQAGGLTQTRTMTLVR